MFKKFLKDLKEEEPAAAENKDLITDKVLVFLSSVREGGNGLRVGRLVVAHLQKMQHLSPVLIDPIEYEAPIGPKEEMPENLQPLAEMVKSAAGFVLITHGRFGGIPPVLGNLMGYFDRSSYKYKPVQIVSYSQGPDGGVHARAAHLVHCNQLGLTCLPGGISLPNVSESGISEEGECENEVITAEMEKLCKEMDWYINAFAEQRKKIEL